MTTNFITPSSEIRFHASQVHKLMTNTPGTVFTEINQRDLDELQEIKDNPKSKITPTQLKTIDKYSAKGDAATPKQKTELARLIKIRDTKVGLSEAQQTKYDELVEKRDKPFELSVGAKTYIDEIWEQINIKSRMPVVTNETLKGHLCEQDVFELIQKFVPSKTFRVKHPAPLDDADFVGWPDLVLDKDGFVEDAKAPYTAKTFRSATLTKEYKTQLQVYMHLTGHKKARLFYGLVNTPDVLVEKEKTRFFHKFNIGDGIEQTTVNHEYEKCIRQIEEMHNFDHIPEDRRLKVFYVEYDEKFMDELVFRIQKAREYYDTLSMPSIHDQLKAIEEEQAKEALSIEG